MLLESEARIEDAPQSRLTASFYGGGSILERTGVNWYIRISYVRINSEYTLIGERDISQYCHRVKSNDQTQQESHEPDSTSKNGAKLRFK